MPQAKLPDINNAWVRYRNYGLESIDSKNYSSAVAAIYEIIALFPENYRCEINTDKRNVLEKDTIIYVCGNCSKENNHDEVKIFNLVLDMTTSFISGNNQETVWNCLGCDYQNRLQSTEIIKSQLKKPYYFKVIREPPNRKQGIMDRVQYDNIMRKWFFEALAETDHQLGLYRDEYRPTDEEEEAHDIEGGEEEDDN